jgi:carbonic anhydrase
MSEMLPISEALAHNVEYGARHGATHLPTEPKRHLAIVTCMDSRLDLFGALGLDLGEAHIIRNAGGIATDDVVRSLILSQRKLGTERIMLIHHTRCGLHGLDEDELRREISEETGVESSTRFGSFSDIAENVRATARVLNTEPALRHVELRGFIFDVDTGFLEEIELELELEKG